MKKQTELTHKKALQPTNISVKFIIEENKDLVSFYVFENFNNALPSFCFAAALKDADKESAFKTDDKTDKENYRPISRIPNLYKIYEKLMYVQMYTFFDYIFQKLQCAFLKV